jgi:hypothetical protein
MIALEHHDCPLPDRERNDALYAGKLLVFRGFTEVAVLVESLADWARDFLGEDPQAVHTRWAEADLNERADQLQRAVRKDPQMRERLRAALAAVGMDPTGNYEDGLKLRVQMAHSRSGRRRVSPLGAHRDTWGTRVLSQVNWWAPVFPTNGERTLAFYPSRFRTPVANDSTGWDFAELLRRLRVEGPEPDYPLLPLATEALAEAEALAVSLLPGDLLAFSGAHLHASVPNRTDRTRISWEVRTVTAADQRAGRGAPEVDGEAVRRTLQLFRRLTDRERLGEMERV